MEKAVESDDELQGLFMQCTFLAEHLKMGSTQWIMILVSQRVNVSNFTDMHVVQLSMDKSFIEKQGLLPKLQDALKLLSVDVPVQKDPVEQEAVKEEADQGMEDMPVDSHGETQETDNRQNLSKCTQLYKTIGIRYRTRLARMRKAYLEDTRSKVNADSHANLPLDVYEEYCISLTKHIQLPPIFHQLLQEETKREAELEKQRSLSEGDTPQGNFDKELGMECPKLSGEETGQLEFERLALLQYMIT